MSKKSINFGTLKIGSTAISNIQKCLDNHYITMGEFVKQFERKLAHEFECAYAVAVNSGTSADTVAYKLIRYLRSYNKRQKYILCPGLAFISMATAIVDAGYIPLFVDIEKETLNINPHLLKECVKKYKSDIAAIVAVNTMGKPCALDIIRPISLENKIPLIIDNCEGHGATLNGKVMEDYADICTYSFYPAHAIIAGEMGAITTNNDEIVYLAEAIRSHGREPGSLYFDHKYLGGNYKPLDIIAAIGLEGLNNFTENFNTRRKNVKTMRYLLDGLSHHLFFSEEDKNAVNCPHAFSITLKRPDHNIYKLIEELNNHGIQWKRNFGCIPEHASFNHVKYQIFGELSNSTYVGNNGIHWGVHQELTDDDCAYICSVVYQYFLNKKWLINQNNNI